MNILLSIMSHVLHSYFVCTYNKWRTNPEACSPGLDLKTHLISQQQQQEWWQLTSGNKVRDFLCIVDVV